MLEIHAAKAAPICTMGPSRPIGSPHVTTSVVPMIFAAKVCKRRIFGIWQPFKKALRPGKPEPLAAGARAVNSAAVSTNDRLITTKIRYALPCSATTACSLCVATRPHDCINRVLAKLMQDSTHHDHH